MDAEQAILLTLSGNRRFFRHQDKADRIETEKHVSLEG
jgi:hypothetical protein